MRIIVGLGNPGKEYEKTRHNVGFRAIDELSKLLDVNVSKNKFDALIGETNKDGEKIILMKPQTYMNLSGNSVVQALDFYKIEPSDILVIYDDIDVEIGKIRIREFGSAGTHNGMKSIVNMLATEEFPRIRIGTDKPKFKMDLANYVLTPLSKEEDEIVQIGINNAAKAALMILDSDVKTAMNKFNGINGRNKIKDESDNNK